VREGLHIRAVLPSKVAALADCTSRKICCKFHQIWAQLIGRLKRSYLQDVLWKGHDSKISGRCACRLPQKIMVDSFKPVGPGEAQSNSVSPGCLGECTVAFPLPCLHCIYRASFLSERRPKANPVHAAARRRGGSRLGMAIQRNELSTNEDALMMASQGRTSQERRRRREGDGAANWYLDPRVHATAY
jgi:hypothetical protein